MAEEFSNSIILPGNLPHIREEDFNPVDRKYLRLILIRHIVFLVIMTLSVVGFKVLSDEETPA